MSNKKAVLSLNMLLAVLMAIGLVACEITSDNENSAPGRIIVIKQTSPDGALDSFPFTMSYGAQIGYPNGLSMRHGQQVDSGFTLPVGTYTINESVPAGWEVPKIAINDPSGGSSPSGTMTTIGLAAGETVTVTYNNTVRPGRIIVIKQTSPDGAPDSFPFTMSYGAQVGYPNGLSMRDGQLVDSGFTLAPGTYTINESVPAGWELTKIDVNISSPVGGSSGSQATIPVPHLGSQTIIWLAEGETVIVTYYNTRIIPTPLPTTTPPRPTIVNPGRIIIVKQTSPDGAPDSFPFTMSYGAQVGYPNGLSLHDGQQVDSGFTLPAGTYTINELVPAG